MEIIYFQNEKYYSLLQAFLTSLGTSLYVILYCLCNMVMPNAIADKHLW